MWNPIAAITKYLAAQNQAAFDAAEIKLTSAVEAINRAGIDGITAEASPNSKLLITVDIPRVGARAVLKEILTDIAKCSGQKDYLTEMDTGEFRLSPTISALKSQEGVPYTLISDLSINPLSSKSANALAGKSFLDIAGNLIDNKVALEQLVAQRRQTSTSQPSADELSALREGQANATLTPAPQAVGGGLSA